MPEETPYHQHSATHLIFVALPLLFERHLPTDISLQKALHLLRQGLFFAHQLELSRPSYQIHPEDKSLVYPIHLDPEHRALVLTLNPEIRLEACRALGFNSFEEYRRCEDLFLQGAADQLGRLLRHAHLRTESFYQDDQFFSVIFDTIPDAVTITRLSDGCYIEVNRAFCEYTGYLREEALGRTPAELQIWADPHFRETLRTKLALNNKVTGLETRYRNRQGQLRAVLVSATCIPIRGEMCMVGGFRDISDRKHLEERLSHIAEHNHVTGLVNRHYLQRQGDIWRTRWHQYGIRVAYIYLDLDRFKNINHSFGYGYGDLLLQAVAQRLLEAFPEEILVTHLAADEFLLLVPFTEKESIQKTLDFLRTLFVRPFQLRDRRLYITASSGVIEDATYTDFDLEALIQKAHSALNQAKRLGSQQCAFYTPVLDQHTSARLQLEGELREALDNEEFFLVYQPQIDMRLQQITGVEALIRWQHPKRGLVSPAQFIPVAQETGLIIEIGAWVLQTACHQMRQWQQEALAIPKVAVNVSGVQIEAGTLLATLDSALQQNQLDPNLLELEISEDFFIHQADTVLQTLTSIREQGVKLSIDDFGTGYSSLSQLHRLPLDILKIDKSFIDQLAHQDTAIVQAIIGMAKALDLEIIAEGVETAQQAGALLDMGCSQAQGYLYSPPLPLDALADFIKQRSFHVL